MAPWACVQCTFLNETLHLQCAICGAIKPQKKAASSSSTAAKENSRTAAPPPKRKLSASLMQKIPAAKRQRRPKLRYCVRTGKRKDEMFALPAEPSELAELLGRPLPDESELGRPLGDCFILRLNDNDSWVIVSRGFWRPQGGWHNPSKRATNNFFSPRGADQYVQQPDAGSTAQSFMDTADDAKRAGAGEGEERGDFEAVWDAKPAMRKKIKIFDKVMDEARFSQAFGESYWYSGTKSIAKSFDHAPHQRAMLACVKQFSPRASMCLTNWYDQSMYIGFHADDEKTLIHGDPIFSITWGATRTFQLRPFKKKLRKGITSTNPRSIDIDLVNGDLLIMGGTLQKTHKHAVPDLPKKLKEAKGGGSRRINFTFRSMAPAPAPGTAGGGGTRRGN